jgi:hypothetical protein
MLLSPGETFDRHVIDSRLGEGGMASSTHARSSGSAAHAPDGRRRPSVVSGSLVLSVLVFTAAASSGAAAAAIATGDVTPVTDLPSSRQYRAGVVLGISLGGGIAGASGYPNNQLEIGDPTYYSASGPMGGTSTSLFVMGALSDYVSVGFFFLHGSFGNGNWRSSGDGGGLRLEGFPLVGLVPALHGLGVLAHFGFGSGSLTAVAPGYPGSDGTQSFGGAGLFHEWAFGHTLGGHLAAGPSLEYDAIWSPSFERHGLVASVRLAFYGGP